jgi:hypothetical protein
MPYSAPTTIAGGQLVTAGLMNTDWAGNIAFLANPPACRVYHNATQSIAHATETSLIFNSEDNDTDTMHDTVTNNGRITFNTAGLYVVTACIPFDRSTDYTHTYCVIRLNGTTTHIVATSDGTSTSAADADVFHNPTSPYKFAVNDWIDVRVYHRNGAATARNINPRAAGRAMFFSAVWHGLG